MGELALLDGMLLGEHSRKVEHAIEYILPSGLVRTLASLQDSIRSVNLVVSSEDIVVVERQSVRLSELDDVIHGADGALLYRGEPIKAIFENFYLLGSLDVDGEEQTLKPHYRFAKVVRSVTCGDWRASAYGGIVRDILDYRIVADALDWREQVIERTKVLVAAVTHASGVYPFLMAQRLDLVVMEDEMPGFLSDVHVPKDLDEDYPVLIM